MHNYIKFVHKRTEELFFKKFQHGCCDSKSEKQFKFYDNLQKENVSTNFLDYVIQNP